MARIGDIADLATYPVEGEDQLLPPLRSPAAIPLPVEQAIGRGLKAADYYVGLPSRVMGGVANPYPEGSDLAQARENIDLDARQRWGASTGLGMVADPLALYGVKPGVPGTTLGSGITPPPKGIRAYHSSPHDFEKFDASKIGTGQGAASYGVGHYLAENPKVSGQGGEYWHEFSSRFLKDNPEGRALDYFKHYGLDRKKAAGAIDEELAWHEFNAKNALDPQAAAKNSKLYADMVAARDLLASGRPVGPRTYEVDINARPEQFLDWDKPLAQQAPEVRRTFENLPGMINYSSGQLGQSTGAAAYGSLAARAVSRLNPWERGTSGTNPLAASESLREAGIPGIRYLDQGSRAAPALQAELADVRAQIRAHEGYNPSDAVAANLEALRAREAKLAKLSASGLTSNYVIFPGNEHLIDIMKKYAVPAGVMGTVAAQDRYNQ